MTHKKSSLLAEKVQVTISRRSFLKFAGGAGLTAVAAPTLLIPKSLSQRELTLNPSPPTSRCQELWLSFYNRHTGESLTKCPFGVEGKYNLCALKEIDHLFRDHRTHAIHEIDRNLLHVLYKIQQKLDTHEPFHLISGYRSPQSNRMLSARSRGVAKNSQHIYGKAADIYVPGRTLKQVQGAAKSLRAGGVGRYAQFVHVDTGRVRYWGMA